jgi:hypothetical protein
MLLVIEKLGRDDCRAARFHAAWRDAHPDKTVRDWLSNSTPRSVRIPGGTAIVARYALFCTELPAMCEKLHLDARELTFNNYVVQVEEWLKLNAYVAG